MLFNWRFYYTGYAGKKHVTCRKEQERDVNARHCMAQDLNVVKKHWAKSANHPGKQERFQHMTLIYRRYKRWHLKGVRSMQLRAAIEIGSEKSNGKESRFQSGVREPLRCRTGETSERMPDHQWNFSSEFANW